MSEEQLRDVDEDGKTGEDEYSTEDIERELSSKLMIEKGHPLPVKKIVVNMWRSGLHGARIGIKKDAQWQSKSRQFSPEMDIVGDALYEFDEEKMMEEKIQKYYELDRAVELVKASKDVPPPADPSKPDEAAKYEAAVKEAATKKLEEIKREPKTYQKLIIEPLAKLPKAKKQGYMDKNNEKLDPIPAENDRKLIIALNQRYWDTEVEDKSAMEEVDIDQDGKVDKKRYLANYLTRKFGEFAGINRRLIIKVFRDMAHSEIDKRGIWMGTIEQSLLESMAITFGEKDPLFSSVITLPAFDYQVQLVRSHAITGHRFVMPVISRRINLEELFESSVEKNRNVAQEFKSTDKMPMNFYVRYFLIEGKRFTPGTDYIIKDPMNGNKVVAKIDGRAIDIGGRWDITFLDEALSKDAIFRSNVVLFTTIIKYHPDAQRVMRSLHNEMKKKVKDISDDELEAALTMYIERLEKRKGISISDKPQRIAFAKKLIKDERYDKVDLAQLLRQKYHMNITPHELSMMYNPRRVRS
ncbi:MAG: hypothetical protein JW839_06845 [Candidatus Lokiarchaeota archaeon]|nr:hypothetical protein [Candidatus Lokiarchaeota archaeon]